MYFNKSYFCCYTEALIKKKKKGKDRGDQFITERKASQDVFLTHTLIQS